MKQTEIRDKTKELLKKGIDTKENWKIIEENMSMIKQCLFFQHSHYSTQEYADDFFNDLMLLLLQMNTERLKKITYKDKALNAFVTRIIKNNLHSTSSNFYSKYKKFKDKSLPITGTMKNVFADEEDNYKPHQYKENIFADEDNYEQNMDFYNGED